MPNTFDFIEDAPAKPQFDFQPDPEPRTFAPPPGAPLPRMAAAPPLTPFEAGQIPSRVTQAQEVGPVPELTGAEMEQMVMAPQVTIPNPIPQSWPISRGLFQTAKSIPEFLTAPAAPEILMAQKIPFVREAIDAAMGAGMVKSAAELAGESSVTGDREKMTEAISSGLLGATMVGAPHLAPIVLDELAARRVGRPDLTQVDLEAFPGPANMISAADTAAVRMVPSGRGVLVPKARDLTPSESAQVFDFEKLNEESNREIEAASVAPKPAPETTPKKVTEPTPLSLALEEQRKAGWDTKWPFVPADLQNASFRDAIRSDPSLSSPEKARIFKAGKKLGVVPRTEFSFDKPKPAPAPETPKEQLYREASEARAKVQAEYPPIYQQMLDAGVTPKELSDLGIPTPQEATHPSEVSNIADDISRNAPGDRLNKLYNALAPKGKTGRFLWGGTSERPQIGFEPDVPGARPDPVAARRALDVVNRVRGVFGREPLPDFFKGEPAPETPAIGAPEAKAPEPTPPAKVEAPAPKPAAETGKEKGAPFAMTFEQFLNAPREGRLLEELRKLPRSQKTEAQLAAQAKYDAATENLQKAGLSWVLDRADPKQKAMVDAAMRKLPKAKQKIVSAYESALNEQVKSSSSGTEGQRRLYDKAVEAGIIKPPETPPTGPGMVGLGGATPSEFPTAPSNFRHWWDQNFGKPALKVVPTIKALWNGHQIREGMAYLKDWVENQAKLFARSTANDIRQPLRRLSGKEFKLADNALSMVIEAKGNPEALDEMRIKLIDSTKADPWWRKQAMDALNYAVYHWEELSPLAEKYKGITSTQVDLENASNIPTLRREGYVPHRQEIDEMDLLTSGGQGQSTFFEKPRSHDTFADSIAAGIDPKTLSATDLLEHRLSSGTRLVNSRKWMDTLRGWKDPTTGAPIATNLQPLKRADGSTVMVPPTGYVSEMVGPHSVAILKGYEGTFNALTDPSFFTKNMAGRAFMTANATGKSINLLIDTFHLGRLAFWDSLIKGLGVMTFKVPFPSYRRGLTMLDYTASQIREMAANGEIPKKWLGEMLENKRRLDLAVKSGYNVGRISDALYQDVIHSLPVVGKFNKWLFDQFQRGAMAESWLLEFERARRVSPKMSEEAVAREVTKDLNIRFGNIGRQGWFKSKTAQDAARVLFLAPQWNEGLIKSELGAVREAGKFAMDAATGKRLYAGTLLRSVGAMALMQFAANQIINQATRGKFTWENEEEGWGSKLSAWVPDIAGNGPGFFLHPLGLAAETTHLLTNLFERSGGDTSKVILDYARSRSSAAMRPILTLLTRTDFLGHHIKPDNLWGEVVKSAIPTPIVGKAVTAMGKQMVTGQPSEQYAGQFQKQAMQSMGIRTEGAPSPEQRINRLAQEWRREKGVPLNVAMLGVGDYQPLVQAVRVGNMATAQAEIDRLLERHTDEEIKKHFRQWQKAPFTGSHVREREFRAGLTPVQDIAYIKARDDRERVASEIRSMLR